MFANCQLGGLDLAAPDVCQTPPLPTPIPYVNVGLGVTAIPNVLGVQFSSMPAHNLATINPVTTGDEAGSFGGVCSGTIKGLSKHITGVQSFLVVGFPATRLTSMTQQNIINAIGMRIVPSQPVILLLGA
ncbi:DUF4150 domain-containing protein [Proteus mirabilis]|uniref:DUF4150 domain-containing protein n=1 Tax=Proteus mirabilis TaxID=584 RepID=UPI000F8737AC|nr:DUF4150 domain-containing protein [Proteus mirabilis]MDC9752909.1 DUF4150 domain-containing protein [Proteus mirabilis]MDC9767856.1 DUF4150 domain-containing protein [Proteus mirabilis]RUL08987.1 DUF4150 domain-containing protein [Proteus mirabilis]WJI12201.1 DUF4150 domain-containing protein [Proteus mirabilis]HCT3785081.1 DUF4150 domain-containing protein [Proteus mirabilis]